jgi:predicted O-methyltransferase YrrM
VQEGYLKMAKAAVANYTEKVQICRNFTTECAKNYADDTFDFVYVDARHDYKVPP